MRSAPALKITAEILLRAYAAGLFPMAENADDPKLFWLDPERRGVFPLGGIIVSKSLRKVVRSDRFAIAFDRDFDGVIDGCAEAAPDRPSTWINGTIRTLYRDLFHRGAVHTVEAYRDDRLVGGLYGVAIGGAFFGESMFHRETDASKSCLIHLAANLLQGGFRLLDAQFVTPHLATLGAVEIPRLVYREQLAQALPLQARFARGAEPSGLSALATLEGARGTG